MDVTYSLRMLYRTFT